MVALHAHPDDEVLLTGGTLARAAASGCRVVVVVATDRMWDEPPTRLDELRAAAAILGVHRVVHLGYADSGHGAILFDDPPGRQRFVRADLDEAASRLAALLAEENADVLLSYDSNGGYGHRDHVKVHEVGRRAAELTGVRLLEATMPRDAVLHIARVLKALRTPFRYEGWNARSAPAKPSPTASTSAGSPGRSKPPSPPTARRSRAKGGCRRSCGCWCGCPPRCSGG